MAPTVQPLPLMLHRLTVSLGISVLIAVAGCSGAEESDLFGPEASGGNAPSSSSDTPATSSDSTTPSPGTGSSPSAPSDPAPADPKPSDPGTAPDPGTQQPVCAVEGLANDEFKNADAFASCISGKLIDKDVDYVSTVAPANAKQILIEHSEKGGKVAYKVYVNGMSATFFDTPPADLPAIGGAKYTFKVERPYGSTGDREWELKVTFQ
jgi:hypothetical protein